MTHPINTATLGEDWFAAWHFAAQVHNSQADRISNLHTAPAHWTADKRAAYRAEAQTILDALGPAHAVLADRLATKIAAYT